MTEPKTCNKDHIGIQWTASGGCPLCPSHARIAELERKLLEWQEAFRERVPLGLGWELPGMLRALLDRLERENAVLRAGLAEATGPAFLIEHLRARGWASLLSECGYLLREGTIEDCSDSMAAYCAAVALCRKGAE